MIKLLMKERGFAFTLIGLSVCLLSIVDGSGQGVKVDSPSGLSGTTVDLVTFRKLAVVVSIPTDDQLYLGSDRIAFDQLGSKIGESLKRDRGPDRIVYITAGTSVNYGSVVKVLNIVRDHGVGVIGLVVHQSNTPDGVISYLLIQIPMPSRPNDDLSKLKPNPLTLVASISAELQLKLNHEGGPGRHQLCFRSVPHGLGNDPGNLEKWLACLFRHRTAQHAYKTGMETRSDVPEEQRIEKTVFVKASRAVKYGDVIRVIDAIKGAGASPIGLQIDDLPQ